MRTDIHGVFRAPEQLEKHLLKRGGVNIYGEPVYRLVWAPSRMQKRGGNWYEWDENIPVNERNGIQWRFSGRGAELEPFMHRPKAVHTEVRDTRKYAFEGWVLERWIPAHMYGSPEAWYRHIVPGTELPKLGPYPHEGDYEMVAGGEDSKALPTIGSLDDAIAQVEAARNRWRGSVEQEVRTRCAEADREYQKSLDRMQMELSLRLREGRKILFGTSLEAGRIRNELAKRAGVTGHVGN
jgi:hypothetical protein